MRTFFTADQHWGHTNIIKYQDRPFKDIDEMNTILVNNWNAVVGQYDTVYHLGDFALMPSDDVRKLRKRLNGEIHIIWGNHDKSSRKISDIFASNQEFLEIGLDSHHITLCHYGMRVWNKSHRGSLQLYGHSHGRLPGNDQSLDVGVDYWNYFPITLKQILDKMKALPPFRQEDFHGWPTHDIKDETKEQYG